MKVHQGDVNDGHQIDDSVGPSDFNSECYTADDEYISQPLPSMHIEKHFRSTLDKTNQCDAQGTSHYQDASDWSAKGEQFCLCHDTTTHTLTHDSLLLVLVGPRANVFQGPCKEGEGNHQTRQLSGSIKLPIKRPILQIKGEKPTLLRTRDAIPYNTIQYNNTVPSWFFWYRPTLPVSSQTYKIPPSILSYCTTDKVDGTMEFQYPVKHIKSHRPSYPIVPRTRWTVPWNPSIQSNIKSHHPSYPIVPRTRWTVPWNPSIQLNIKSHRPSYPIVPRTRWMVPWNPSIQSNI